MRAVVLESPERYGRDFGAASALAKPNPTGHVGLIGAARAMPGKASFRSRHRLALEFAPDAYARFDARMDGYAGVSPKPQQAA